jgi:protein-disulfide isomerase
MKFSHKFFGSIIRTLSVEELRPMKRCLLLLLVCLYPFAATAQTHPAPAAPSPLQLEKTVEAYLRNLFAWGPTFQVKLGPFKDAELPGFYVVPIEVTVNDQSDHGTVYVSKDGRFMFRGDINNLGADPFADNREHLHLSGDPSKGPADAAVSVVIFSDFQCPHCRLIYQDLKSVEPRYPQVRFVFKDFPLTQIHPWAMTAALAARCAYQHSPDAFLKVHGEIFDHQDTITAESAWATLLDYATQAGIDADDFRACMASPDAKQAIEADIAEGMALKISSTPTLFVNGRPLIGGAAQVLVQYIDYELALHPPQPHPSH